MAHTHLIYDTGKRFIINPATKTIDIPKSNIPTLSQYDHNSEYITFEMARFVEGHDLSLCDKVEIHYNNIEDDEKRPRVSRGFYEAQDLRVDPNDKSKVIFTWAISQNATTYKGLLYFVVSFVCLEDEEVLYRWNTIGDSYFPVSTGINNADYIEGRYADLLELWRAELFGLSGDEAVNIQVMAQKQLEAIEEKGNATLNSIPNEYKKLQSDVNDLGIIMNDEKNFVSSDFKVYVDPSVDLTVAYNNGNLSFASLGSSCQPVISAKTENGSLSKLTVALNSIPTSAWLPVILEDSDNVYGIRFLGSSVTINKFSKASYAGSKVLDVTSNITSLSDGDVIKHTFNEQTLIVYVNGVKAFELDMSDYFDVTSSQCVGVWITGTLSGWQTSLPVIASDVSSFVSTAAKLSNEVTINTEKINRLENASGSKYYHMSFDDCIEVFEDLTINAAVYNTVFENEFMAWIKEMHDTYGTTFSLFCFYENADASFNLSNCTDIFSTELAECSDWLRFGFHSLNANVNYKSDGREAYASEDYNNTVTQLIRITGSVDCIDRMPRIQNYAGSKTSLIAMRDADCGIVGVLTAQDYSLTERRDSYYFSEDQNEFMFKHCKQYDYETQLTFVKTAYVSDASAYVNIGNLRNVVEVFLHENSLTSGMKTMYEDYFKIFVANGYVSGFQMDYAMMR